MKTRQARMLVLFFGAALLLSACSGGGGGGGGTPGGGTQGMPSVVTKVYSAVSTTICPSGGIQVDAGIDDNGSGVLDASEVDSTQYVCNGLNGTNGTSGLSALVSVTTEPTGTNCANGGSKVSVGLDANGNTSLDNTEITSSKFICNGANGGSGINGTDGYNTLVSIVTDTTTCLNGGLKITSGLDVDKDSVLGTGEAGTPTYVCNGTNGLNGNTAPIANAGTDQKVAAAGLMVTLDGSGSSDPDGSLPAYVWSFTNRPVGSLATLSSLVVSNPTFTPDKAGKYELSLVVNDGTVNSPADTVMVRAGMPVPDTGQTRWYSTAFGDDGDYTINPMSYTDNGDGTILDNVTGLTWQKCSMGQSGLDCATGTATTYDWATSGTTCGSLSLAGTGWRLPTDFELMTIVDYGIYSPLIDSAYFPKTIVSNYWSSTSYAPVTSSACYVDFLNGLSYYYVKTAAFYVRCVRGQ